MPEEAPSVRDEILGLSVADQAEPVAEPAAAPSAEPAVEPIVRRIELYADVAPGDLEALSRLLAIEVGQPLTETATRRTLTNFHASGLASEVEIRTRPIAGAAGDGEDGVVAVVAVWGAAQVSAVEIAGELGLPRGQLQSAVVQQPGQPLIEDRVVRGVFRLLDLYHEEGYLEARVVVKVEYPEQAPTATPGGFTGARQGLQARVLYQVDSGPRARVGEVVFNGEPEPLTRAELLKAIESRPGRKYTQEVAQDDANRLRTFLLKRKFRTAEVSGPAENYRTDADLIDLTYEVRSGPVVNVTVTGADLGKLEKEGLLPFMGRQGYDEALLLESTERVRRYLQEKGHYDATVESRQQQTDGEIQVRLTVVPGPVFELAELRLDGNAAVSESRLQELMETSDGRLFGLQKGRLVDSVLRADLENLRAYYALNGFLDADVGNAVIERTGGELRVTIPIVEGMQRQVADVVLRGADALELPELEELARQRQLLYRGGPFHPLLLEETVDLIQAWYQDRGWSSVRVASAVRWNDSQTLAEVTIDVETGPRTVADQVIVRGNFKTDGRVIRRALDVEQDQPLSRARLLELQRRLYRLGVFSRVAVELAPAEPGATRRDVVVRVQEGRTRRLSYGLGYDTTDGPRGLLGYTDSNLAGRAYTLRADLRLSARDQRFRLAFDQPAIGIRRLPLTYSVFYVRENRDPFVGVRWGGRVGTGWRLTDDWRFGALFEYRIVEPDDPTNSEAARENQRILISSLAPNLQWDTRNDLVNPSRGGSGFYQLEYAFNALGTDEQFSKLFVQQTQAVDLGRPGVLAGSLRLGAIEPRRSEFGDLIVPPELPNSQVAISERFFAGGPTSHRAFQVDELGINDRTIFAGRPVGGNGLLLFNLDYRFPIYGALGGTLFFDAGNVWADWRDVDLADLRLGLGFGITYLSPIGPLNVGVGWKLDRQVGEDSYRVFVSVGNPF